MEEKKFENQNLNSDLFQDYIDSLPEEEQKAEGETPEVDIGYSGVSDRVEQDLLDYKRKGYGEHTVRNTSRVSEIRRSKSRTKAVGLSILTMGLAMITVGTAVTFITNRTYSEPVYYEPPAAEEYVDPYEEEYNMMSGDLSKPEIFINGKYVSLPLKMSEFMQDEWRIRTSAFSETVDEIGTEPVSFHIESEWGEEIAEVSVVSPTGEPVPVEDALITGLYTDSESYWYELNGGVYVGSSSWTVEDALKSQGIEWTKKGNDEGTRIIVEAPAENEYGYDQYVLRLELEDETVERITMQLSQSQPQGAQE